MTRKMKGKTSNQDLIQYVSKVGNESTTCENAIVNARLFVFLGDRSPFQGVSNRRPPFSNIIVDKNL